MRRNTLYFAVLTYCCEQARPVCALELLENLDFAGRRDFKQQNLEQILMTAANNGILNEGEVELSPSGQLLVKYYADSDQQSLIRHYLEH